jgi:hypothetical protein
MVACAGKRARHHFSSIASAAHAAYDGLWVRDLLATADPVMRLAIGPARSDVAKFRARILRCAQ